MKKHLSHTAKPSSIGALWRTVRPIIPNNLRETVRRSGQYVHSRKLTTSDTLLLSYPKSGSTWLRDMLSNLLAGDAIRADDLAGWVPPLHRVEDSLVSPRIIRSHDRIDTPGFSKAKRKIVLIRDPRSLVVSWAFHQQRRGILLTIEESTESLLNEGFSWLGSWKSHAKAVESNLESGILLVKYEDLHRNTADELSRISEYLNLTVSPEDIERSVVEASPDKLRKRRIQAGLESKTGKISDIRNAKTQGWKTECPESCVQQLTAVLSEEFKLFGYEQ